MNEEIRTSQGSKIQRDKWYVSRWSSNEEQDGFISEAFNTKRDAVLNSGCCSAFHREGKQYYTANRTHVCKGGSFL